MNKSPVNDVSSIATARHLYVLPNQLPAEYTHEALHDRYRFVLGNVKI